MHAHASTHTYRKKSIDKQMHMALLNPTNVMSQKSTATQEPSSPSAWNMTNSFLVVPCHLFIPNGDKENILEKQLLMDGDKWFPVG